MTNTKSYDFVIIGGGLFGCYAALYLARKKKSVLIIEKEADLLRKASVVNQARLHAGYHYPRSVATALMSDDNKARFTHDHQAFINDQFDKYYAIDRNGSFTDSIQFERFCEHIGLSFKEVTQHPLFDFHRLEALYLTQEQTFDPILIANYYRQRIKDEVLIDLNLSSSVTAVDSTQNRWKITITNHQINQPFTAEAEQVINATYAASNAVHEVFGLGQIELMHELSEMVFVTSPQVQKLGLTIMDGPFASLMPYGHSGLLSLSSVAYTHHKVSNERLPTFDCQPLHPNCRPNFTSNCTDCHLKPSSNYRKMISQMSLYFQEAVRFDYFKSMFTIKSKLKANYIDDGRPTEISIMKENPRFYCIFAGKINSIYEIERIIDIG